jgi:hypothetical protein
MSRATKIAHRKTLPVQQPLSNDVGDSVATSALDRFGRRSAIGVQQRSVRNDGRTVLS